MKQYLKKIYELLPLKPFVFGLIKSCISLPPAIYQHLHFKGVFKVKIDKEHSFLIYHHGGIEENEIFWKGLEGGWEKRSTAIWTQLASKKQTILDIGANTGLYAMIAKTINPSSAVHAFEPIPAVFQLLNKNKSINHFDIHNHEVALSDFNGIATIYLPDHTDFAYSVTVNQNRLSKNTKVKELTIKTKTLSQFIEENKIQTIDLMKIDVETHEPEVLLGMGKYLNEFRPTMLIEVLDENIAQKLDVILKDMNYLYFNIDDKNNSIRQIQKVEKSDYWNLLICNESTAKELNLI